MSKDAGHKVPVKLSFTTIVFLGLCCSGLAQQPLAAINADDSLGNYLTGVGWKPVCILPACNPGGLHPPAATSQTINHPVPSKDGESMLLSITSPTNGNSNALWVYLAGSLDTATTISSDFWVYLSANSKSAGQFEFDNFLFSTSLNTNFMWGMQCDQLDNKKWQVWNYQAANKWVDTTIPCSLSPRTWYHIQVAEHRVAGDTNHCGSRPCIYYDRLTINGTVHTLNISEPAAVLPAGWASVVGFQFQMDVENVSTTVTENLDLASFSAF